MAKRKYKRDSLGRFASANASSAKGPEADWPSILRPTQRKSNVKFFPGIGWAPVVDKKAGK
jgi:hypothetical protein